MMQKCAVIATSALNQKRLLSGNVYFYNQMHNLSTQELFIIIIIIDIILQRSEKIKLIFNCLLQKINISPDISL